MKENKLLRELTKVQKEKEDSISGDEILQASKTLLLGAGSDDLHVLKALQLDHIHNYQTDLTSDIIRTKKAREIYETDVFTGSQVKELCTKFYLKICHVSDYNGPLTAELPRMVKEFCEKNNIDVQNDSGHFFILAPIEQFRNIKHVPVKQDPILFYRNPEKNFTSRDTHNKVTEECVLAQVYNWGNDFSSLRKLMYMGNNTKLETSSTTPSSILQTTVLFMLFTLASAFFPYIIVTIILIFITSISAFGLAKKSFEIDTLWNVPKI